MIRSRLVAFAALNAAIAIMGGAFAAHGLNAEADAPRVLWLKTAAEYQLIHAVALLAVAQLGAPRLVGICFAIGIALFSGSLYLMVLTSALWLGIVTPLGGVAFIIGWLALAWHSYRSKS